MMDNNNIAKIFEDELQKEILQSEKTRAALLGIASFVLAISIFFIAILYNNEFLKIFRQNKFGLFIVIAPLLLLTFREFSVFLFFKKRLKYNQPVKNIYRYVNVFVEASIPTIMILVISVLQKSSLIIITPVPYLYFIFIILSVLNLDYKLSLFTGAVAAVEYIALVFYLLSEYNNSFNGEIFSEPYFYIGKSIIMMLSGGLAGFAADQLRKKLLHTFNALSERNKIINMFGQQVSKEIVDELLLEKESAESKRKFVCIMFLDIRGFTNFSEKKEPEEIIKYQNDVFGFMIESITENHGIINQFLGDGYMATFGAPISSDNDCQNAVNAALKIIETVNRKSENNEISNTRIGIGLHAGNVVAGNVGTSIRKQYSITGNTVILSSRIEQLNKEFNSQLLISEEVYNEIDNQNIKAEFIGPIQVKGREHPINIYKLA